MSKSSPTVGKLLRERLGDAAIELFNLPVEGARDLPMICDVKRDGSVDGPLDNKLLEFTGLLVESKQIYTYGDTVVFEEGSPDKGSLSVIAIRGVPEKSASGKLANLCVFGYFKATGEVVQYPPPAAFVGTTLTRRPTLEQLPRIQTYARRPIYDSQFRLCDQGWYPDEGLLVHSPRIGCEPLDPVALGADSPAIDRLPPHLRQLLGDFCFSSDADLANTLGVLITGLTITHFIEEGHPLTLLDGNQPGVGKSLLATAIGTVMDGVIPDIISYSSDDEEIRKRITANIMDEMRSCLIFDNAKIRAGTVISSPAIEANCVAPTISLRILGKSKNFKRPNDCLWFITMNDTKVSPDLVSRCVPIRLFHEGDPGARRFSHDALLRFAKEKRLAILSELAEMVERWKLAGRPAGSGKHRLSKWGSVVSGIMEANGFPEFLQNAHAAAGAFNTELDDVAALAEKAMSMKQLFVMAQAGLDGTFACPSIAEQAKTPQGWVHVFDKAGVLQDQLTQARGDKGRATAVGKFLGKYVDREVPFVVNGVEAKAILRRIVGAKAKQYAFEIRLIGSQSDEDRPEVAEELTKPRPTKPRVAESSKCRSATWPKPATAIAGGLPSTASLGGNAERWE